MKCVSIRGLPEHSLLIPDPNIVRILTKVISSFGNPLYYISGSLVEVQSCDQQTMVCAILGHTLNLMQFLLLISHLFEQNDFNETQV